MSEIFKDIPDFKNKIHAYIRKLEKYKHLDDKLFSKVQINTCIFCCSLSLCTWLR